MTKVATFMILAYIILGTLYSHPPSKATSYNNMLVSRQGCSLRQLHLE